MQTTNIHEYIQPYNDEAERAVLGALILESEAYFEVDRILQPGMFYHDYHQSIYEVVERMHRESIPVDMLTIAEELRKLGRFGNKLNPLYIAELTSMLGSASHIVQHALYIKQEYVKRQLLYISNETVRQILSANDISDVLDEAITKLEQLEEGAVNTETMRHIKEYARMSIDEAEKRTVNFRQGITNGIHTGSANLDKITGGWQNGDLAIIAARPAMGKTAFALSILEAAASTGNDTAMFALEMKGERLIDRLILEKTGIADWKYKQGSLTNEELELIAGTSSYLYSLPVYIDDNSCQTISRIKSKCRMLKRKGRCRLVIIDYLQLTESEGSNSSREQEVAYISREAKKMAKSLDVPVIMLSQLNRALEARADKRPHLSDIRESGAIEQDADIVMFIHRPEYYKQKLTYKGEEIENGIELIIAKYREGATGSVFFRHDGSVRNIKDA